MSISAPARPVVVLLVLCLLGAVGCAGRRSPEPMTGAHLSVLTYNVNFGGPRPDLAVQAIAEANADVVCLQETNPAWERMIRDALGERYPHVHFRHEPGAGGIAMLSKWPVSSVDYHRADAGWFPACIATVQTPAGPVQV